MINCFKALVYVTKIITTNNNVKIVIGNIDENTKFVLFGNLSNNLYSDFPSASNKIGSEGCKHLASANWP